MEAPQELHRRPTLSHFMSRVESSNLRDLLKVRQDDADAAARRRSGDAATRTLATILACDKRDMGGNPSSSSSATVSSVTKTLLDIIRDEHEPHQHRISADGSGSIGVIPAGTNRGGGGVVNWKALRDRLRLRRANEGLQGAVFGETSQQRDEEDRGSNSSSSSSPAVSGGGPRPLISILELESAPTESPAPDRGGAMAAGTTGNTSGRIAVVPPPSITTVTTTSATTAYTASSSTPSGYESRTNNPSAASSTRPHPPAHTSRQQQPQSPEDEPTRVSLMALLEQADRTGAGAGGPAFAAAVVSLVEDGHGDEVKEPTARTASSAGVEESVCCVCMVRNKGAAFIPCGHTFCRVCTRELWVSRGTCPLCNGFILEILDIF